MVVVAAAAVIALIAVMDARNGDDGASTITVTPTPAALDGGTTLAATTTNVRDSPDRFADVVAIMPGGRSARPLGRSSDGAWVQIAYPPESSTIGWVLAEALELDAGALERLDVLVESATPPAASEGPAPTGEELPDLTIEDAFLLQDGRLAVGIRNIGSAPVVEIFVPLNVSRASGDILGVLRIGPTTLAPGASATVVTPILVTETGSYLLELDRADEIRESEEFNNSFTTLLVAGGG